MTAEIVLNNRKGGPERVMDLVAERAPDGLSCLEGVVTSAELAAIVGGIALVGWIANQSGASECAPGYHYDQVGEDRFQGEIWGCVRD